MLCLYKQSLHYYFSALWMCLILLLRAPDHSHPDQNVDTISFFWVNDCFCSLRRTTLSLVFSHWAGLQNDSSFIEMSIFVSWRMIEIWRSLLFPISKWEMDAFFRFRRLGSCLFFPWYSLSLPEFRCSPGSVSPPLMFIHSVLNQPTGSLSKTFTSSLTSWSCVFSGAHWIATWITASFLFFTPCPQLSHFSSCCPGLKPWLILSISICSLCTSRHHELVLLSFEYFFHSSLYSDCLSSDRSVLPEFLSQDFQLAFLSTVSRNLVQFIDSLC